MSEIKFHVQEPRPEVLAFALMMEQRLRDKDEDKGQSWKDKDQFSLRIAMFSKANLLERSVVNVERSVINAEDVPKHAVDLANYAMMITDVAGALEVQP